MTVQNVIVKNIGIGNGSTTRWPYTFACPKEHADFIKVYVRDNDDKLSLVENYLIDTESKMVTYPIVYPEPGSGVLEPRVGTPLAEGERIVIARELPLYQLLNLIDQGSFYAEDIELTFDELVMMIQQLNEKYDRTMTLEIDKENFNMAMPIKAGYGWRVSDDGKSIVLMENPEEVYKETVTTYQQTLGVYNNTVTVKAETDAIKTATSNIQKATQGIYDKALTDVNVAKVDAINKVNEVKGQVQGLVGVAEDYSDLAHRWADSDISPDGQVDSKSSKTWAKQTASYLDDAIKLKDYAEALAEQIPHYDNNTVYNAGDVVFIDNGDAYRALVQVQGENPAGSFKWSKIQTVTNTTFEMDEYGDLMPKMNPTGSTIWDIDENGDITPTAYGSGTEQKPADDIIIENQRNIGKNKVAIDGLSARVDDLENKPSSALTENRCLELINQQLGVIENGTY